MDTLGIKASPVSSMDSTVMWNEFYVWCVNFSLSLSLSLYPLLKDTVTLWFQNIQEEIEEMIKEIDEDSNGEIDFEGG